MWVKMDTTRLELGNTARYILLAVFKKYCHRAGNASNLLYSTQTKDYPYQDIIIIFL